MEWMIGPDAQALFVGVNQEFPTRRSRCQSKEVASWAAWALTVILWKLPA